MTTGGVHHAPAPAGTASVVPFPKGGTAQFNPVPQENTLLDHLRKRGITPAQIASAKAFFRETASRLSFAQILIEMGLATDHEIAQWIAEHHGWSHITAQDLKPVGNAMTALPGDIARTRYALPLKKEGNAITVAIGDPEVPQFAQVKHALAAYTVKWVTAPFEDIKAEVSAAQASTFDAESENEMQSFVEKLFRDAANTPGVSDIHFVPEENTVSVKFRLDGELVPRHVIPGKNSGILAAQIKLSSTRLEDGIGKRETGSQGVLNIADPNRPQDGSAVRRYGSKKITLRYSIIPSITGPSAVIRLLDQNAQVGDLSVLGMLEDHAVLYQQSLRFANGLILNCGPTGHGKSTSLAAAIKYVDVHRKRVLTIEDPVEYRLRHVTQFPIIPDVMGFAEAIRRFLRHNPDVILVGEIRDRETAKAALEASLTGHLILSTVHANTALGGITRMLGLGSEPTVLASSVRLLLSQRLVRKLCKHCRQPHARNDELLATEKYSSFLKPAAERWNKEPFQFYEAGGGCSHCAGNGYSGRMGIFELRPMRRALVTALGQVTDDKGFDFTETEEVYAEEMKTGKLELRTIEQDGMLKAAMGKTSPEEIWAKTLTEE